MLNWQVIPVNFLEEIFLYLPWIDRSAASLTCKHWLNVFCSSKLWRRLSYKPKTSGKLSRIQYDIRTQRVAKCFRYIGPYLREINFSETTDFFMLNRVLYILGKYLEIRSIKNKVFDEACLEKFINKDERPNRSRVLRSSDNKKYQRSKSCHLESNSIPKEFQYPLETALNFIPVVIETFRLDFHSEIDEQSGLTYGSGGHMLTTIENVVKHLEFVRNVHLSNLLLSLDDARNLISLLSETASLTITSLNLNNIAKKFEEPQGGGPENQSSVTNPGNNHADLQKYWFLDEEHWLSGIPERFLWNPLCDVHIKFPCLQHLELSITQLTGAMLLRLVYSCPLTKITLVKNDFTELKESNNFIKIEIPELDTAMNGNYLGSIDWNLEVPVRRNLNQISVDEPRWTRIPDAYWRKALSMQERLTVTLKIQMKRWRSCSIEMPYHIWLSDQAPVDEIILQFSAYDLESCYEVQTLFGNDLLFKEFIISFKDRLKSLKVFLNVLCEDREIAKMKIPESDQILFEIVLCCPKLEYLSIISNEKLFTIHGFTIFTLAQMKKWFMFQLDYRIVRMHNPIQILPNWFIEDIQCHDINFFERFLRTTMDNKFWKFFKGDYLESLGKISPENEKPLDMYYCDE